MRFIILLTLSLFVGCDTNTRSDKAPIGYIGFIDDRVWAIQFNDCTEHQFLGAEKYLWYDRQLTSISCYSFRSDDKTHLKSQKIETYKSPALDSPGKSINRFSELEISESGWGIFPKVYEIADGDWFRLKDGWIHLEPQDKEFVQFYRGAQNISKKGT